MHILTLLIERLLPLYAVILIGFVAGRLLDLHRETIARLVIYVIMPAVVLHAAATTPLSLCNLSLPLLYLLVGTLLSFVVHALTRHLWDDATPGVLAFTAGTANTGYFGLPVAMAALGDWCAGLVIFTNLGLILYENGVGYYHLARSRYSWAETLRKLSALPALYAFVLGLVVNLLHPQLPAPLEGLAQVFRSTYTLLGMMIIGLGLSGMRRLTVDVRFLSVALLTKFAVWPLLITGLVWADHLWVHLLTPQAVLVLLFMSYMPLAANTVVFATELRAQPEKAALAVFLSTLVALLVVPLARLLLAG